MSNSDLIRDLTTIVGDPDVRLEVLIDKLVPFPFEYDRRIEVAPIPSPDGLGLNIHFQFLECSDSVTRTNVPMYMALGKAEVLVPSLQPL